MYQCRHAKKERGIMSRRNEREVQMNEYLRQLREEEKSQVTINKYKRDILCFLCFAGEEELTKEICLDYKASLQEKKLQASSINSMLAALNGYLRYSGRSDCVIRQLRTQKRVYCSAEKELTRKDYEKMLKAAESDERLKLLLQTMAGTGIRVSELKYFTVESVEDGEIEVKCKNKIRTILIPDLLREKLLAYIKSRKIKEGPVFRTENGKSMDRINIWKQMKRLCRKAGIAEEKVFPHNLRKLFARTFYKKEHDLAMLGDLLGHSSLNTTRIYIKSTGQEHRKKMDSLNLVMR